MKKWQKDRNYKRIRDKNGNIVANVIRVFDKGITVSDELFDMYSSMDRRARYIEDDVPRKKELSLERLTEDGIHWEYFISSYASNPEDKFLEREQKESDTKKLHILSIALKELPEIDRELIQALFYDELSTREYACRIGISQRAVIKRRDRILKTLKNFFEKFGF